MSLEEALDVAAYAVVTVSVIIWLQLLQVWR
jgi:hypothetical protein